MLNKKTALLVGATGLIGSQLLPLLLADSRYQEIRVLTRRSLQVKHANLKEVVIDFAKLAEFDEKFFAVDDVFCCLGTTMKQAGSKAAFMKVDKDYPLLIADKAKQAGAKQFLLVSALGANAKSPFFYNKVKGEVEAALAKKDFAALQIFRPSLLLGDRREFRVGEKVATIASRILAPFFIGFFRRVKPIKGQTVAMAMQLVAARQQEGIHIYESRDINQLVK